MSIISAFIDLLFPPKCIFCARVLHRAESSICEKCVESLPYTDYGGKQPGDYFDYCVSALHYKDAVRKSLLRYKFRNAPSYADAYGKMLAECIIEQPDLKYDHISWVPLSSTRKRSRGYDQAMLLAFATALNLDTIAVETLKKTQDVQAQSDLSSIADRRTNISGAYEATDTELIEGKSILLIDDIITTASTLSECAKVLLDAGASSVICATLARGE